MDPAQSKNVQSPWAARQAAAAPPEPARGPSPSRARQRRGKPFSVSVRTAVVISLLAAAALAGIVSFTGGGHRQWPAEARQQFLARCAAYGEEPSRCRCGLNWLESHETLQQLEANALQARSTGATPADAE